MANCGGHVRSQYGSVAKAEEAFRKGTSLDERSPLNAQGFRMIAAMRQGCGDHAAAVDLLDRALAGGDAEQRVECLFLRGACQHALGYHERAVADYDAALTANQSNGKEARATSARPPRPASLGYSRDPGRRWESLTQVLLPSICTRTRRHAESFLNPYAVLQNDAMFAVATPRF